VTLSFNLLTLTVSHILNNQLRACPLLFQIRSGATASNGGGEVIYPRVVITKSQLVVSEIITADFFATLPLNNLGFRDFQFFDTGLQS